MLERKGLKVRLAALAIDALIVGIIWGIIYAIVKPGELSLAGSTFEEILSNAESWARKVWGRRWWPLGVAGLGMAAVELFLRQTPGKMLFKLKILNANQASAGMDQMAIRVGVKYGVFALYLIMGLLAWDWMLLINHALLLATFGSFFMIASPPRQTLPDLLAKTAVFGPAGPVMAMGVRLAFLEDRVAVPGAGFAPVMPGQQAPMPPGGYPMPPAGAQPMPPAGTPWAPPDPTLPPAPTGMAPPPPMAQAPMGQSPMPPPPQA
jgi:uncharacterized RDD family membrane protein YckC